MLGDADTTKVMGQGEIELRFMFKKALALKKSSLHTPNERKKSSHLCISS